MTARAHIRTSDLAELLMVTSGPLDITDPDVSLRCWFALNSADPDTANELLADVADLHGRDYSAALVARMHQVLEDAGPDGIPA